VLLLGSSISLARRGSIYRTSLTGQLAAGALAEVGRRRLPVPGASLAYYYMLVTWATVVALARYLRRGVSPVW
jgi:hypothetical protein